MVNEGFNPILIKECKQRKGSNHTQSQENWLCLKWGNVGWGRRESKHAIDHYKNKHHKISINTQTMALWWYKWDFDLIEEGINLSVESQDKTEGTNAYK